MSYKLIPAEPKERELFYRLDGEAAESHGAIGYMRADFGRSGGEFENTWFDAQTPRMLNTVEFKSEFQEVIDALRNDEESPPFASRGSLQKFCFENKGLNLSDSADGFKIQTLKFTYAVYCSPFRGDYDIRVYAYDNRYLLKSEPVEQKLNAVTVTREQVLRDALEMAQHNFRVYTDWNGTPKPGHKDDAKREGDTVNMLKTWLEEFPATKWDATRKFVGTINGWGGGGKTTDGKTYHGHVEFEVDTGAQYLYGDRRIFKIGHFVGREWFGSENDPCGRYDREKDDRYGYDRTVVIEVDNMSGIVAMDWLVDKNERNEPLEADIAEGEELEYNATQPEAQNKNGGLSSAIDRARRQRRRATQAGRFSRRKKKTHK